MKFTMQSLKVVIPSPHQLAEDMNISLKIAASAKSDISDFQEFAQDALNTLPTTGILTHVSVILDIISLVRKSSRFLTNTSIQEVHSQATQAGTTHTNPPQQEFQSNNHPSLLGQTTITQE